LAPPDDLPQRAPLAQPERLARQVATPLPKAQRVVRLALQLALRLAAQTAAVPVPRSALAPEPRKHPEPVQSVLEFQESPQAPWEKLPAQLLEKSLEQLPAQPPARQERPLTENELPNIRAAGA
jgi:K+-sensing histidine kinase KdpD